MPAARVSRVIGGALALGALATADPHPLLAQVSLASPVAQVALVARVAPQAAASGVEAIRETGRRGSLREASVKLRLSTNRGYRLVVLRTAALSSRTSGASRVWVRAGNGEFQELTPGSSVTVLRNSRSRGEQEHEVSYRIDAPESGEALGPLPVRYEMRIDPTI